MKEWRKDCQELKIIPDPMALFHAARRIALALGKFDVFTFSLSVPGSDSQVPTVQVYGAREYPEWYALLADPATRENDPIVKHARRSMLPINWDYPGVKSLHPSWTSTLPPGLVYGYSQPTCGLGTALGIATLARSSGPVTDDEEDLIELPLFHLSMTLHEQLMRINRASGDLFRPLNNEELEIARWTSVGKQPGDIASLMGLTETMVRARIVNMRGKMKTYTTTHAVIRAYSLGLIQLD